MIQVTYQKKDGSIFHRIRNTSLSYKIGDITSMGWKVLNVEYKYKDTYYPLYKYNILIQKEKQKIVKNRKTIKLLLKDIKSLFLYFIVIMIINIFKILLGI